MVIGDFHITYVLVNDKIKYQLKKSQCFYLKALNLICYLKKTSNTNIIF